MNVDCRIGDVTDIKRGSSGDPAGRPCSATVGGSRKRPGLKTAW